MRPCKIIFNRKFNLEYTNKVSSHLLTNSLHLVPFKLLFLGFLIHISGSISTPSLSAIFALGKARSHGKSNFDFRVSDKAAQSLKNELACLL